MDGYDGRTRLSPVPAVSSQPLGLSPRITIRTTHRFMTGRFSYVHPDAPDLVHLQDIGGKAKPYQVKQLLQIIERYNLQLEDEA